MHSEWHSNGSWLTIRHRIYGYRNLKWKKDGQALCFKEPGQCDVSTLVLRGRKKGLKNFSDKAEAIMYPKRANGYEKEEQSLSNSIGSNEAVPPPLPAKRLSALDEVDNPEVKERKETKAKAKRKDKEMGTDV